MVKSPLTSMVPEMVFVLEASSKIISLKTRDPGVIVALVPPSHVTVPPLALKVGEPVLDVQSPATVIVPAVDVKVPPPKVKAPFMSIALVLLPPVNVPPYWV